mmetsp:Transcript_8555/g.20609  ORF Transcript_8555/g.20609 Transcript_8555/m.20609 type:complete len:294 (+) Transcript_8555:233-1114(+)
MTYYQDAFYADDEYSYNTIEDDGSWTCCNDRQTLFILFYFAFCALAILFHDTVLAKPVRLIATFIHEMSHATVCWLTCGEVRGIQVYDNDGGVTTFVGGMRCLIIPAGYVGLAFSAMVFVIMSAGKYMATVAIVGFTISLVVALFFSPNRLLVCISLGYAMVNVLVTLIEYTAFTPILQFLVLYYGVTVGVYAIIDIHDDTVFAAIEGSDAHACTSQVWPCCHPQTIGLQWAFMAILFQLIGIWVSLLQMSHECNNLTFTHCLSVGFGASMEDSDMDFEGLWLQFSNMTGRNQ